MARIAAEVAGPVLDWGCGHGQVSALLQAAGVEVVSLEWDPDAAPGDVRTPPRHPEVRVRLTPDAVALPFDAASFDAVLSMGVLEHVQDPDGSLEEIRRVLRPGGTLYVFKLPNRRSYLEWVARRAGLYYHGSLPDDRVYTLRQARELVERHGFDVVEARRANMLPLTLTGRWARRHARAVWRANVALARVPLLHRLATNVELVARPRSP